MPEREPRDLFPKTMYQCVSKPGWCKFEWNCGPLCACVIHEPKGGAQEAKDIKEAERLTRKWRMKSKLKDILRMRREAH